MGMLYSILIGAGVLFLTLLLRRKKYEVSIKKVLLIQIVVTIITTLGANLGSFLGGMSFLGLRLYGILILDTVFLPALAKLFKMEVGSLGDYLAVSIIAVCCIVKVPCIVDGCCYGKELFVNALDKPIRFPSQIVEFSIWAALTVWLFIIERKGKHENLLWPIASIWFGIFRFLVDFMRGNPREMKLVILGLPAGRFWSLFVAVMGSIFLTYLFHKYYGRKLSVKEFLRLVVGLKIFENITA
jgi:prolipoprotein diacylglyceryltransferase